MAILYSSTCGGEHGVTAPCVYEEIREAKILYNMQCKPEEMKETVKSTFSK